MYRRYNFELGINAVSSEKYGFYKKNLSITAWGG
jgi:hypothetical protein